MSVISSYRSLFALTGRAYVVVAFVARLPLAMSQMGTLLLVAGVSGSYGAGGVAAGAIAVTNAIGSPLSGAISDRIGQRPVLLVQSVAGSAGLSLLVVLSSVGAPWQALAAVAGATGLFLPQVGTMARVRWRELTADKGAERFRLTSAAFSYEGSADEASFVLGPALVGLGAAFVSPSGSLILAAVLLAVFGLWFALHPTAAIVAGHPVGPRSGPVLTRLLVGLALGTLCVGMVFGSVQTGTTALATEAGQAGYAGLLHALLGVGSVVAGLTIAGLPARFTFADRLPVFGAALAVLAVPLLAVHSIGALAGVLLLLGLAVAPYLITVYSACEATVDPRRLGAAMMALAASTSLGYALGSSLAGQLADRSGYGGAYAVTVGACAGALGLALVIRPALGRAQRQDG
ncbi:MFS transporter [Occultella glacieicola]|uniref:MFS transporter n=2 Tax=Occultella glacieicola TaxID=2518684 RepID=A0ABY2E1F8_9MICO|nr:MFS transporter [Occultella glacieicola]